jgi:hypothetical protein
MAARDVASLVPVRARIASSDARWICAAMSVRVLSACASTAAAVSRLAAEVFASAVSRAIARSRLYAAESSDAAASRLPVAICVCSASARLDSRPMASAARS